MTGLTSERPSSQEQFVLAHEVGHAIFHANVRIVINGQLFDPKEETVQIRNEIDEINAQIRELAVQLDDAQWDHDKPRVDRIQKEIDKAVAQRKTKQDLKAYWQPLALLYTTFDELYADFAAIARLRDPLAAPRALVNVPLVLASGRQYQTRAFTSQLTEDEWRNILEQKGSLGHSTLDKVRAFVGDTYLFHTEPVEPGLVSRAILSASKHQIQELTDRFLAGRLNLADINSYEFNQSFIQRLEGEMSLLHSR